MKIQSSSVGMSGYQHLQTSSGSQSPSFILPEEDGKSNQIRSGNSSTKQIMHSQTYSVRFQENSRPGFRAKRLREDLPGYRQSDVKASKSENVTKNAQAVADMRMEILRRIFQLFAFRSGKGNPYEENMNTDSRYVQYESAAYEASEASYSGNSQSTWFRRTVPSSFYAEEENMAFETRGFAKCEDGRMVDFGVTLEMSRSFVSAFEETAKRDVALTDPLVINFNASSASVTDYKFMFDLDADGNKELISFAGQGSGFLALDKNGNGKIDDGNELFGTHSGNGFSDLAKYDFDGNGWIDENDPVFEQLKIWTKDENGNDHLMTLKDADVGAIYLGNASTNFSLTDKHNNTDAIIRSSGIFLKESGGVSTVQQVDLVSAN